MGVRAPEWVTANAESLGRHYTNDTRRHFNPAPPASPANDGK